MGLMQTWVDVYPCEVENKGGETELQATKSVVTSNDPPWEFYKNGKVSAVRRKAFCERFDVFKIEMGCLHPKSAKCACPRRKTAMPNWPQANDLNEGAVAAAYSRYSPTAATSVNVVV